MKCGEKYREGIRKYVENSCNFTIHTEYWNNTELLKKLFHDIDAYLTPRHAAAGENVIIKTFKQ